MKTIVTFFVLIFIVAQVHAQVKAVTENGDTILVYDNGTWEMNRKPHESVAIETTVKASVSVDEFSKHKRIETETWFSFGKYDAGRKINGQVVLVADPNNGVLSELYSVMITVSGMTGCLSKNSSTMQVKLSNGEVVEFIQVTSTECGDNPSVGFVPANLAELDNPEMFLQKMNNNLDLLRQYDWETIRIRGTKGYIDFKPNPTQKAPNPEQFFRQHLVAAQNKLQP